MKFDAKQFVADRHKAFADVLYNDSIEEMLAYMKKYNMDIPHGINAEWIIKAGTLKAIQDCTDFTEEEKTLAMKNAIAMRTNPFMRPYDYDAEENEHEHDDKRT